ncbi:MAG: fumarate reductase/succinate dehydrogenase flavoprotein subunit, partial [Gemmatimonadetes bacterium]|nr:fumarate reductase/succinate dehydrogenase flavoprotein subunit [Gemmatimonadota bacterium]NIU80501.1 fumarate reductase/succinate dehydrogenase flavoprotein subunit [Gammaproteobacteria bacterium]NIP83917.1 fumarate reductase/succinate dehydrogenase flavoprotein subunit [Gemmatimonadota bacterium]NIV50156.1 fumarate reductase/succinate dehydrogenase flavoprotein subunit [Gammaproteobacteria bacterium]NIW38700.1 fumarate reductase/succinate dehydrogenase flavoprotein subunit [Gemmatimonadota
ERGRPTVDQGEVDAAVREALAPLERPPDADAVGPYRVLHDIQELMQEKAGIIRDEEHLREALEGLERIRPR